MNSDRNRLASWAWAVVALAWAGTLWAAPGEEIGASGTEARAAEQQFSPVIVPLQPCGPSDVPQAWDNPDALVGVRLSASTSVLLREALTAVQCEVMGGDLSCRALTTYSIANPGAEARIQGEYYGASSGNAQIELADRPFELGPISDGEELARINRTALAAHRPARGSGQRGTFDFVVPSGMNGSLQFESSVEPCQTDRPDTRRPSSKSLLKTRHFYFAPDDVEERQLRYSFELWPVQLWTGRARQKVKIGVPRGWSAEVQGLSAREVRPGTWEAEQDGSQAGVMVLTLRRAARGPVLHGGPLFAVGGRLDRSQVRLRVGYELGIGESISTSLVVDHEPQRYTTAAWMWEIGTRSGPFLPALAIGTGPLLRMGSGEPAPGARVQGSLSFKLLSVGVSLDMHPSAQEELASFLWGQFSL